MILLSALEVRHERVPAQPACMSPLRGNIRPWLPLSSTNQLSVCSASVQVVAAKLSDSYKAPWLPRFPLLMGSLLESDGKRCTTAHGLAM